MKKDMPLEGLRWSRDSGSALYDTPQNGRSRTGWGGKNSLTFLCIHLYDLDVPIRGFLHIPNIVGIPLVILMCFVGTYIMSKIPFTRMVYNIKPF